MIATIRTPDIAEEAEVTVNLKAKYCTLDRQESGV